MPVFSVCFIALGFIFILKAFDIKKSLTCYLFNYEFYNDLKLFSQFKILFSKENIIQYMKTNLHVAEWNLWDILY